MTAEVIEDNELLEYRITIYKGSENVNNFLIYTTINCSVDTRQEVKEFLSTYNIKSFEYFKEEYDSFAETAMNEYVCKIEDIDKWIQEEE